MASIDVLAALWLSLALIATMISKWLRVANALSEVVVGIVAQLILAAVIGSAALGTNESWIRFLSDAGMVALTFLAGADLDPLIFKLRWKEVSAIGLAGLLFPFLGCTAATHYLLGWDVMPSWLAGVAMATTSVAVVYSVMMEFGFNASDFGKTMLAACFVTDLGSAIALGTIFARFTTKTLIFLGGCAVVFVAVALLTPRLFKRYRDQPGEFETKFLLVCLLGMGALATWADSEAVLPSYLLGMVLAGTVGKDRALVRRLRTLTFGLLTPFYFIRVGSFVSIPAIVAAPAAFVFFLTTKIVTKAAGVFPATKLFGATNKEAIYTSLLMSTGLTFGTIASLFGFTHKIIDVNQYSALVAAVIASAVIPTVIANAFFLPQPTLPAAISLAASQEQAGPMLSRILHANDGSEDAFRALALALAIAKQNRSDLHMVSVETSGSMPDVIQRARKMAEESRVVLHTHVLAGHPVRSVVDFAAELKAELLVIGARGRSSFYERLVGSRADRIMQFAVCPVLVVK
jgi:glutathione-regulated potassium-efflux system ancillary protein KefC